MEPTINGNADVPEHIKKHVGAGQMGDLGVLDARDYFWFLMSGDCDIEAQLMAIRDLLHRNRQADEQLDTAIKEAGNLPSKLKGFQSDLAVDHWVELCQSSVYQGAAHSMAAVGMLAPFIENLFFRSFKGMQANYFKQDPSLCAHKRWEANSDLRWDCHFVLRDGKPQTNIVEGIFDLGEAVGVKSRLPNNLKLMLEALFAYRNKMFHCGFEWPQAELEKFAARISKSHWPSDWFESAKKDGKPWIFYLSEGFIEYCFSVINQVMDAFGEFVRDVLAPRMHGKQESAMRL